MPSLASHQCQVPPPLRGDATAIGGQGRRHDANTVCVDRLMGRQTTLAGTCRSRAIAPFWRRAARATTRHGMDFDKIKACL